jgi:medium-chain acyl-[acyl-carrier-protein] hydrolase
MARTDSGDDHLIYRLPFDVRFNDVDQRHRMTVSSLFGFLQEAAIRQADENGFGAAELVPRGLTWVINRVHLQIGRYPAWKDLVVVETWPSTAGGLYATREFRLLDENGRPLVHGTSRWVLVDISARRAVRIPKDVAKLFSLNPERAIEDNFAKIRAEGTPEGDHTFHVRRSDLDANNHANSGRYFDWMLETAPPDLLSNWEPGAVEIVYKQEALSGDTICAAYWEPASDSGNARTLIHTVNNVSKGGACASGRSFWRPAAE